jgi:serine/threonine protein kinase
MTLAPGTKIDGYEILGPLGAGGMGEVYRARDGTLKRDVAIKVLPEYWSRDPERLRRFEQEAQATAALNHPNIVSIFHVGEYAGSPYIVTELLQGESLRERLRKGPMRLREVLDHGVEMARGLAAAHDAGIVHRDLKPENIWVTKDGRIKILDFGLAKLDPTKAASTDAETVSLDPQSHPGQVLGTVGYMSPEQVRGQVADARSDIFAVGVILYEMLTGKPAFRKGTSAETMTAILNEDPPAVSQLAPSVPPGLQKVVNRCLAKNPEKRFQHASDLEFALESMSESGSTSVMAIDQNPRSRWIWIVATAVIVALAAGGIAWWKMPRAVPVVESVTQLTDDGELKQSRVVTDGSRIYFSEGPNGNFQIAQVSVSGGPTAVIPTKLVNPWLAALSPDGSSLLTQVNGSSEQSGALWSIPLPAGEPRRLGSMQITDAGFLPDGRMLLTLGSDLYVAEKDGSNPHKLVSAGGSLGAPSASPDGKQIVFTMWDAAGRNSLVEIAADGTELHTIQKDACCSLWTPDGKYLVYGTNYGAGSDIWALPMQTGPFQRSREPVRLTTGPLSYIFATPSSNGKQIFAIGLKERGELVRYDMKSKEFVPFLAGISAMYVTFSRDGEWVTYTSLPDHTLWRSRSDGSERKQLTYPPMAVLYSYISPDGTKVAFTTSRSEIYVIGMDGGSPQNIVEKNAVAASWSPDGNLLAFTAPSNEPWGTNNNARSQIIDLRTGKSSRLPGSEGNHGPLWVTQDVIVAANQSNTKFMTFDFKTQKWTDLVVGNFVNWNLSPDRKYFVFTTGGSEPEVRRVCFSDGKVETIASLKNFRRLADDHTTQVDVAPDGSPVFTRNIGTQEIYALTVKWP